MNSKSPRILLAALFFAAATPASATTLEAGNWKVGVATLTNGQPEKNEFFETCLQAEALKDLVRLFGPKMKQGQASCKALPPASGVPGDKRMRCIGVTFEVEYESSVQLVDSQNFKMRMTMDTDTQAERAMVVTAISGRRLGPCKN